MRRVKKFYVHETGFSDLNEGVAVWDDGSEEYVIDVLKDPEEISSDQYRVLVDQLEKHMVGLVSNVQIGYLYRGVIEQVCETDWVEQHGVEKLLEEG